MDGFHDLTQLFVLFCILQAISQDQHLIIPVSEETKDDDFLSAVEDLSISDHPGKAEVEDLLLSLPRNLHWDKQKKQQKSNQNEEVPTALDILEEGGEEDEEQEEEGLKIAWQYRKSVQQERLTQPVGHTKSSSTATNVFCHSYDLSGRMNEQSSINPSTYMLTMGSTTQTACKQASGFALFRELVSLLKGKEGKAIRILLFHPNLETLAVALPLLLSHIRNHSMPAVVMVCTPPTADCKSWTQLSRTCDVVLSTEGFSSRKEYPPPPEFRDLQGLLTIAKVSTVTAATANGGGHYGDLTMSKRPAAFIYGFKRDRRKLHIPLLHIPPEDYAQGGGSVGSGVRSGGGKVTQTKKKSSGMGCASNMSGSALDF
jgi:hypothetical protein